MRINTGIYKGRKIILPEGIRPTQEKVRKALFDILGDIEGLSFLELFAGSGSVGFEAASRLAKEVVFIEVNQQAQTAIQKNIRALKAGNCQLIGLEVEKTIQILARNQRKFDLIFLDPPYYQDAAKKTLQTLGGYDILAPVGFAIAQHFKADLLEDSIGKLVRFRQAKYGDTLLSFYKYVPESDLPRNI